MTDGVKVALISGLAVTVIATIKELILWIWNRKAKKNDNENDLSEKLDNIDLAIKNLTEDLNEIKHNVSNQGSGLREALHDRLAHLCTFYLSREYIYSAELERLCSMYAAYKALGGNGFITGLMERVRKLLVKEVDE